MKNISGGPCPQTPIVGMLGTPKTFLSVDPLKHPLTMPLKYIIITRGDIDMTKNNVHDYNTRYT